MKAVIFDWGDTLMRDFPNLPGPMAFWPTVALVDRVKEALDGIDRSLICCVASNAGASDAELMGRALDRVGIRTYFDHLFTSKELGAVKPDPQFFRAIADRLGVGPSECVMVGNDYAKDIAGAKAVGMCTIWLDTDQAGRGEQDHADFVIGTMAELPHTIRSL